MIARSPLKRSMTPLKRTPLKRSTTPIRARRVGRRRNKTAAGKYLAWIRTHPCLVCDADSPCNGPIQAHHHGHNGQQRFNDYCAVPLCAAHHTYGAGPDAVHAIGREAFEARFAVSFDATVEDFNRRWEGRTV